MAVRAPTGPTQYIDKSKVAPRAMIITTEVDYAVEDQHYALQRPQQLIGDQWHPSNTYNSSFEEIARYYLVHDLCGWTSTRTAYWCAYGWASAANNFQYQVRETGGAVLGQVTVSANHTTPLWRGWGSITLQTDGTENEVILEAKWLAGNPNIYTCGFALFIG